ncbi:hypothetical protein GLW00_07070 [Halobacillus litoralis]|uniref:Uncharacterized protein n=1 Tax=Halobacillus litoralis TaxID=45668 RepID=A0A845F8R1_9BACI|nr:hypothetical protein [Halobacillus litoralis]MYL70603.1 hypothetical protein [Halobacillus litoralis]
MGEEKKITFMLPDQHKEASVSDTSSEKYLEFLPDELTDLVNSFDGFELDTIELHVTGALDSGGATKLFVDFSGEAGMKFTLKKKEEKKD